MRFKTRDLVYIAILGAVWGVLELTLGSYLHIIFPQVTTPLVGSGTILTALGMIIALTGRRFIPRLGTVFMIGVVVAIIKALSVGGVKLSPMVAILIECLLAELGLALFRRPEKLGYVLAGALALLWTFLHKFFGSYVFLGKSIGQVYQSLLGQGAAALGISVQQAFAILLVFVAIRLVIGGVAGWLGWLLGGAVRSRLASDSA